MRIPKGFVPINGEKTMGATKMRYRMLADGSILDQNQGNRFVGFVDSPTSRDDIWRARGNARQKMIRSFIK